MNKLLILKLDGTINQGFQITLAISSEGHSTEVEVRGALPPVPTALVQQLQVWKDAYRKLGAINRTLKNPQVTIDGSLNQRKFLCKQAAEQLANLLNEWLKERSFIVIRDTWCNQLKPDETARLILQVQEQKVAALPWHRWDLLERYPKLEIGFSLPEYEARAPTVHRSKRILAILGDSEGIDIERDRQQLEALSDAQVTILVEPQRSQLSQLLWQQDWDILFFAGHSMTEAETGLIYLNPDEQLSIHDLKETLRRSIQRGLSLAIFNSCDGLGLAWELQQLHIPQMIVMREPIVDQVAQAFLRQFLHLFCQGEPFYSAVRQARESLEGLEADFPCASWLPMIWQNPATPPLVWKRKPVRRFNLKPQFQVIPLILASAVSTLCAGAMQFFGVLQPLELKAFDQMMQIRPDEGVDRQLLIIEVTEADLDYQKRRKEPLSRVSNSAQTKGQDLPVSLSDPTLKRLLEKLIRYQPSIIGLDIYRDFPSASNQPKLANLLKRSNLITICKAGDEADPTIPIIDPPPEVPLSQVGFSDFLLDDDQVLRRHLLSLYPADRGKTGQDGCNTNYAFSVQVAFSYLQQQNIQSSFQPAGDQDHLKIKDRIYPVLPHVLRGYHSEQWGGNQLLLNYRSTPEIAQRFTLQDFLENNINPDYVKDKIVLIGIAIQGKDHWSTSIGQDQTEQMPGVVIHAHMISQLINAALHQRPLLWRWSFEAAIIWIFFWSLIGSGIGYVGRERTTRSFLQFSLAIAILISSLMLLSFGLLLMGGWVPVIPSAIAILLSSSAVKGVRTIQTRSLPSKQ